MRSFVRRFSPTAVGRMWLLSIVLAIVAILLAIVSWDASASSGVVAGEWRESYSVACLGGADIREDYAVVSCNIVPHVDGEYDSRFHASIVMRDRVHGIAEACGAHGYERTDGTWSWTRSTGPELGYVVEDILTSLGRLYRSTLIVEYGVTPACAAGISEEGFEVRHPGLGQ